MVNCELEIGKNPSYTKYDMSAGLMLFLQNVTLRTSSPGKKENAFPLSSSLSQASWYTRGKYFQLSPIIYTELVSTMR